MNPFNLNFVIAPTLVALGLQTIRNLRFLVVARSSLFFSGRRGNLVSKAEIASLRPTDFVRNDKKRQVSSYFIVPTHRGWGNDKKRQVSSYFIVPTHRGWGNDKDLAYHV